MKAHLKIAVGIDDDPEFLPKEVEALVHGGMTPLQALQAATISGAQLLNWSDRIGTIEAGKFADIIALGRRPDTRHQRDREGDLRDEGWCNDQE